MTRTPPSETSDPDAHSRRARLVARRHRRTRIIVAIVVLVVAGGAAFAAYAVNENNQKAQAAGSADVPTTRFGEEGTLLPPVAVKPAAPRTLTHADPLRLWIGGDSLAGSFGPALGDRVGETGVVKARIDYRVSSGLWSNDLRNWYQRATEQMTSADPEAVVFMIGTNDTPVVNQVDANDDGVPDWQAVYRMKIARMMDLFVGPNRRTVIWLGPPTLGTRILDRGAKAMGQVMREEADKRAPDVVYLDTYKLFSTGDGTYSRRILDENGKEILARIGDGTHFTATGAEYLARAVFAVLDARWTISKQADLLQPIGFTIASGSGESVPGFSSKPRSRYGSGNNSTSTSYSPGTAPTTVTQTSTTAAAVSTTVAPTTVSSTAHVSSTTAPPTTKPSTPTTHGP
jgi:uncharacterized protein